MTSPRTRRPTARAPKTETRRSGQVLPAQDIRYLINAGAIGAARPMDVHQVQPASLDLRLGPRAHRLQASFLPGTNDTVQAKLATLGMATLDLSRPTVLERGCVYLVELLERLTLPSHITGKANPKSTSGRLDIFTRLLTDRSGAFDHVAPGYAGRLYAEIIPRTFPVIVREGSSLSQLRLVEGNAVLDDDELEELDRTEPLTLNRSGSRAEIRNGVRLRVSLGDTSSGEPAAYRGAKNARIVDLEGRYAPEGYWEPIAECPNGQLILNPGDFYILRSEEEVRVPPGYAAEMVPFDPSVGEIRVHYAGFFDPGFGWHPTRTGGTPAVLEVRAHETAFVLEHGQVAARLEYSRMREEPADLYGSGIGSAYHAQGLTLSKQFTEWARR